MTHSRKYTLLIAVVTLLTAACAQTDVPFQIVLRVTAASDQAAVEGTSRITQQYYEEKRFLRVSIPSIASPSETQVLAGMSSAVVEPHERESDGSPYLVCTIHAPGREVALAMLTRCKEQLVDLAKASGVSLVPEGAP
jgi:hypothetical protein